MKRMTAIDDDGTEVRPLLETLDIPEDIARATFELPSEHGWPADSTQGAKHADSSGVSPFLAACSFQPAAS